MPSIGAWIASCELDSENMCEWGLIQIFSGSGESALKMIPWPSTCCHCLAGKRIHFDGIWNPIRENNFSGDGLFSIVSEELDFEVIPLNQWIDSNSFIPFFIKALCCHHEWNLTWLKVEIYWSEHSDDRLCWVWIIVCTILCLDISIEIALWHSIQIHIRFWQIWHNRYNEFTISQDICLRQVVS